MKKQRECVTEFKKTITQLGWQNFRQVTKSVNH